MTRIELRLQAPNPSRVFYTTFIPSQESIAYYLCVIFKFWHFRKYPSPRLSIKMSNKKMTSTEICDKTLFLPTWPVICHFNCSLHSLLSRHWNIYFVILPSIPSLSNFLNIFHGTLSKALLKTKYIYFIYLLFIKQRPKSRYRRVGAHQCQEKRLEGKNKWGRRAKKKGIDVQRVKPLTQLEQLMKL